MKKGGRKNMKKLLPVLTIILSLSFSMIRMPQPVFAEDGSGGDSPAVRTIMLYICGSDLESFGGMAAHNLHQILEANFSQNDDVRLIVMTGGAKKWKLESRYLLDPDGIGETDKKGNPVISKTYNQIWEARGANAAENAGKLVLLKGKGITGEDGAPVESKDEFMSDPKTLKAFINYCAANFPAQKYDLILWDHGGGPAGGYGVDQHNEDYTKERMMQLSGIMDAVSHNLVTDRDGDGMQDGKFDFIDFDACLMNTVELNLTLADWMDYYIASPEVEPGFGQNYTEWLNALGEDPAYDTFELGRIIVDSLIDFYENGDGKGQDGTLAVVDTRALLGSPLIGAMQALAAGLQRQSVEKADNAYLFYDELGSAAGSIEYKLEGAFDLGNFAGQLAIAKKEVLEDRKPADNPYMEPAKALLGVLDNRDIIYGRGTSGIRAAAQFFLDQHGDLQYEDQLTSGMYTYFPSVSLPQDAAEYCMDMADAIDLLPAAAEDDGRKALLQQWRQIAARYGLIIESGQAISALAAQQNMEEASIHYESVKAYWEQLVNRAGTSNEWNETISPLLSVIGGETEENLQWLGDLIAQQKAETVTKDDVTAYTVLQKGGSKGLRVVFSGTNRRVINGASLDISADLPSAVEYIEKNEDFLGEHREKILTHPLGRFHAEENLDDLEFSDSSSAERMLDDYLKWNASGMLSWDYASAEDKWYAVKDASGGLHAASVDFTGESITVPVEYADENSITQSARLIFKKSGSGYGLAEMSLNEEENWRSIPASELQETLSNVMTVYMVPVFAPLNETVPMSGTSFDITGENAGSIRLEYLPISQISDVEGIHRTCAVTDIYNNTIDISEKTADPAGELIHIEQAEIDSTFYNGSAQEPVVTYNGETLTAGTDYTLYKLSDLKEFTDPGEYLVTLHGKGRFCGIATASFIIMMDKEQAEAAVSEAQEAVLAAIAGGSSEETAEAYSRLIAAQRALAAAQEALDAARDSLNRAELDSMKETIAQLTKQVEDLNGQAAKASVVDISNYTVTMKTSFPYTGKAIRPAVKVSGLNESCYTVAYSNNTKVGTAKVTIKAKGGRHKGTITKTFKIVKAANPLEIKGKNATVKYTALKTKAQTLDVSKVITFTKKGQGTMTYQLVSAQKNKESFSKKFTVNEKTGKVTVGKKLAKGTYAVKVKARAAGNAGYKASDWKTVTFKVVVK